MKRLLWLRLLLCVLLVPQLALGAQLPLVVQWMATAPLQLTWAQSTTSEASPEPLPIFPHAPAVQSTRTRQGALPLCLTCGEPVQLAQAEAPLQLTWTQSTASEASPEPLPNFPHAPAVRSTRTRQGEAQLAQAELDKDELPGLLVLVAEQAGGWGLTKHTGLYDFGARQYDARQGQWLSPDPILAQYIPAPGEESGELPGAGGVFAPANLNAFGYAWNQPTRLVDPTGEAIETAWDVLNVLVSAQSLGENLDAGRYWAAAADLVGLSYDLAASATPGLPAGAGAIRNAPKLVEKGRALSAKLGTHIEKAPGFAKNALQSVKNKLDEALDAVSKQTFGAKGFAHFFQGGRVAKASELAADALRQGFSAQKTTTGPIKFVDRNGVVRLTIKQGSARAPGSNFAHAEFRNAAGHRVDAFGNAVTRSSPGNHTPIDFDLIP